MIRRLLVVVAFVFVALPALAGLEIITPKPAPELQAGDGRYLTLVVGNSNYNALPPLQNPTNDAEAVAELFSRLGHDVVLLTNANEDVFRDALRTVEQRAPEYEQVMFYYAGHGMAYDRTNYLFATDFVCKQKEECQAKLKEDAINMDEVVESLSEAAEIFIAIFDACRDDPFDLASSDGDLNGLVRPAEFDTNTMLVYSTSPGAVAMDGAGSFSPFAEAFLEAVYATPTAEIGDTLRLVRQKVVRTTEGQQVPWSEDSLIQQVSFSVAAVVPPVEPEPEPQINTVSIQPPAGIDSEAPCDPSVSSPYQRFTAAAAFDALGPEPGKQALNRWLEGHHNICGIENLIDRAMSRYQSILVHNMQIAALSVGPDGKGGEVQSRRLTPPEDSPLGTPGRRLSLLIGINDYEALPDPGTPGPLKDLRYAENDAHDFERLLRGGRLGEWNVKPMIGAKARRLPVVTAMRQLLLRAEENDIVLVFFSRHGSYDRYDEEDVYLMLSDSVEDNVESGLPIADLENWVRKSKARQVIFVLDACRSGYSSAGSKGQTDARTGLTYDALLTNQLLDAPNRIFLTSSSADQLSWEDTDLQNGVFTHFLIKALDGESHDSIPNRFVDLKEVFDYTHEQVFQHSSRTTWMDVQEPQMREISGKSVSGFALAYRD
ncbi:caspase family protein [Palleronia pelagia]|uniref:Caspase domain-containing protein n=1 Tax=Palleronia pelagia TaxID=387096 RepID=A0A1H8AFE5_9RHOB|nr:caspase family protein [Palleronia pelagia]SEM69321.1 Caspase domain-containing protein [Palleronia pelagia]